MMIKSIRLPSEAALGLASAQSLHEPGDMYPPAGCFFKQTATSSDVAFIGLVPENLCQDGTGSFRTGTCQKNANCNVDFVASRWCHAQSCRYEMPTLLCSDTAIPALTLLPGAPCQKSFV